MATQTVEQSSTTTETVEVWITDLIEADYVRRNVFPRIRKALANSVVGSKRRYSVTREEAKALYKDAYDRYLICDGIAGRGLKIAYSATVSRLRWANAEKPKAPPTEDRFAQLAKEVLEAEWRGNAMPVGTDIIYFAPGADEGLLGVITAPFAHYKVVTSEGDFTDTDGSRFQWRQGYCIQLKRGGKAFFVPAHTITRDDCKPTHMRLVCCN